MIRPGMMPQVPPGLVRLPGQLPMPGLAASTSKAGGPVMSKAPGFVLPPPAVAAGMAAIPPAAAPLDAGSATCTVYVGRISTEVSDDFVRNLLEKCGKVSKWNRAADPNTSKLTSFGFCDFEEPQGVWRALAFLHEQQLCDKRLLVKCEEKAKQTIEVWKATIRAVLDKKRKEQDASKEALTDEQLEEELRMESKSVMEDIARVLKDKNRGFPELKDGENAKVEAETKEGKDEQPANGTSDAKDADQKADDKKANDKEHGKENDGKRDDNRRRDGRDDRGRQRSRSRDKKRSASEEERHQKEADRRARAISKYYRVSRRERDREHRVRDRDRDIDKEFNQRSRDFERGEDKRISNLKRGLKDLEPPPEPSDREKNKFIDRDLSSGKSDHDERDWKRYREDRASKRQREHEKDEEDRAAELGEAEEGRRKKEDQERKKRKEEEEAKQRAREEAEAERKRQIADERARQEEERRKEQEEVDRKKGEEKKKHDAEKKEIQKAAAAKLLQQVSAQVQEEMRNGSSDGGSLSGTGNKLAGSGGAQAMNKLFREGEEPLDANGNPRKHKPLTRLEGGGEVKLNDTDMRRLIQQVPTDKARAFAFKIDWQIVADHHIVDKKLRPWVKKKVNEFLGAEESSMVEFILRKVSGGSGPESVLAELEGFLDDEAENFTLKMWRMLIFEVLRVQAR